MFCVDYRKLNTTILLDLYIIPRRNWRINTFCETLIFSTLDVDPGYYLVTINDKYRGKIAFTSYQGLGRFPEMSFGLQSCSRAF